MKGVSLAVIVVLLALVHGQPQPWINFKGYWYVLYKGPHPPNVQQPGAQSPPVFKPVPVRVSVVETPPAKSLQAGPQVKQSPVTSPLSTSVVATPATPVAPQVSGLPRQQVLRLVPLQRPSPQAPPAQPQQGRPPQTVKSSLPAPPRTLVAPRLPAPPSQPAQPAPPQQPAPSRQPAGLQVQQPVFQPSQPAQVAPLPRQLAPPVQSAGLGSWSSAPIWNPVPPPPMAAPPANGAVQQYLSPGTMNNRGPLGGQVQYPNRANTGQVQYHNRVQPASNTFHPGPAQMYRGMPGAHNAHMRYLPLEPPDIDLPLTPCGESIVPPTTVSFLTGLRPTPNPDPRCRCEDPQDCDIPGTTVDPVCPTWTTCCCRPLPPTVPPGPTRPP